MYGFDSVTNIHAHIYMTIFIIIKVQLIMRIFVHIVVLFMENSVYKRYGVFDSYGLLQQCKEIITFGA